MISAEGKEFARLLTELMTWHGVSATRVANKLDLIEYEMEQVLRGDVGYLAAEDIVSLADEFGLSDEQRRRLAWAYVRAEAARV